MSILTETSNFDVSVTRKDKTDDVLGFDAFGPALGIANAAEQALANRTLWLKDRLAALGVTPVWVEQAFTATGTFDVPIGVQQIFVKHAKAPGGGGSGAWTSIGHPGGGGGEGAEAFMVPITVTPEELLSVLIGAPGAGGTGINGAAYNAAVLGSAGGDVELKRGVDSLLLLHGGKGGGINAGNADAPGADVNTGQMMGGEGGTAVVDAITHKGAHGEDGICTPGRKAGNGGGRGGGNGGCTLNAGGSRAATDGVDGGGGGGGVDGGDGKAGGPGVMILGWFNLVVTGNT